MKNQPFSFALLACGLWLLLTLSSRAGETNGASDFPLELSELRQKMGAIERSSQEVAQKWDSIVQQNASLSNVLTGLQQTLVAEKERELELSKQAHAFTLKVISGAGAAVFLVFLLSYWFQLRALNRVMEISNLLPAPPGAAALLEAGAGQASSLLGAIKVLESRIQQLEIPTHAPLMNGNGNGNGHGASSNGHHTTASSGHLLSLSGHEATPPSPGSASLLVSKGQTLLDMDRLQDALGCFQEAVLLDPTNADAYLKKGIALERLNRLEPALTAFEEAIQLNPKRAIAHASKARILAALHRYDEAIAVYDAALGKNGPKTTTPIFAS